MNTKVSDRIREACNAARARGIKLHRGPWFTFTGTEVTGACAIGAVILAEDRHVVEDASKPGYVRAACEILKVDAGFLYRFWMGFDRGHQVTIVSGDEESKDEVSAFGMQIAREFGA